MDLIPVEVLWSALSVVLGPEVLFWTLVGVLTGFLFGASPGLTATTGVAIATPLTFGASFEAAMALLLGIYCAGYFAGSIPAILINTPGSPGNAATAIGGYRLARSGKADYAISLAVVGSAVGGIVSLTILFLAAPTLSGFALRFTSAEYFALGVFGLICVAAVSEGSLVKGVIAAAVGMLLSTVGIDEVSGAIRFTFGFIGLQGGVPLIPALIGFFAVTELLSRAGTFERSEAAVIQQKFRIRRLPAIFTRHWWLTLRSALIGTFIGILPGTGPTIASWVAYSQSGANRPDVVPIDADAEDGATSNSRETGATRGIIASETANNAVTGGALVPLLTLGIPGDTVAAVLVGALLIQGIDPGPFFIIQHTHLFAQILLILLLAALMIIILGLAARSFLPAILAIPPRFLVPIIGVLCVTGGFAINNSPFEVMLVVLLGVTGFALLRFGFPMAPIVIGLVLGPIIEINLRNGLLANNMDFTAFLTRPISGTTLALTVAVLGFFAIRALLRGNR